MKVKDGCNVGCTVLVDNAKGVVQFVDSFQLQLLVYFIDSTSDVGITVGIVDFEDVVSFSKYV